MPNHFGKSVFGLSLLTFSLDQPLDIPKERAQQLLKETRAKLSQPTFNCHKDGVGFECENDLMKEKIECYINADPDYEAQEACLDLEDTHYLNGATIHNDSLVLSKFDGENTDITLSPFSGNEGCEIKLDQGYIGSEIHCDPNENYYIAPLLSFYLFSDTLPGLECYNKGRNLTYNVERKLLSADCNEIRMAAQILFQDTKALPKKENDLYEDVETSKVEEDETQIEESESSGE